MAIESDRAEILSGVRRGRTTGGPIVAAHRQQGLGELAADDARRAGAPGRRHRREPAAVVRPRPGHADLAGALKYDHDDMRDVLERASARETAARVAAGGAGPAAARALSASELTSHVVRHRRR